MGGLRSGWTGFWTRWFEGARCSMSSSAEKFDPPICEAASRCRLALRVGSSFLTPRAESVVLIFGRFISCLRASRKRLGVRWKSLLVSSLWSLVLRLSGVLDGVGRGINILRHFFFFPFLFFSFLLSPYVIHEHHDTPPRHVFRSSRFSFSGFAILQHVHTTTITHRHLHATT